METTPKIIPIETGNLAPNLVEYAQAIQAVKICDMPQKDAINQLMSIIVKCYFDAGQQIAGENETKRGQQLQLIATSLLSELSKFKHMSIQDVQIAFKNGVRREYGEFYGLNPATYYQWLKSYQFDEKRKAALHAIKNAGNKEPEPLMSKSEAEYEFKQAVMGQFKRYKAGGALEVVFPIRLFQHYEGLGLIKITTAEKWELYRKAKAKLAEQLKIKRLNPKNGVDAMDLNRIITRIEDNCENETDKVRIRSIACEMAIRNFYDSITELKL